MNPAAKSPVTGKTYYVSSSGKDTNTGASIDAPFATLAKAGSVLKAGDALKLKSGESFFGTIKPTASGTAAAPISIGSYGTGAKPVVTGFNPINNWKAAGAGLYEAQLNPFPSGLLEMVRFQNKLQPKGRLPKAGKGEASWYRVKSHTTNKQIVSAGPVPDLTGGEIVQKKYQWIIDRGRIDSMSTADGATTINVTEYPVPNNAFYNSFDNNGFFVQNHIKTLTEPGDWAYDVAAHKLTVFSGAAPPAANTVEAASIDTLVDLDGKSHIQFENIAFVGSNGDIVRLDSSPHISFTSCDFSFAGRNAISALANPQVEHGRSPNGNVTNCNITEINNNGISLDEDPGWRIVGNRINNIAMHPGLGVSSDGQYIGIFGVGSDSLLQYNEISNVGYCGIYFVGSGVEIRNNHIYNFCMTKSDGGGIYTYGGGAKTAHAKPRIIDHNIVYNGIGNIEGMHKASPLNPYNAKAKGIYMDDNATDLIITNNTTFKNSNAGLYVGSNGNVTISDNTSADNHATQLVVSDYKAGEDGKSFPVNNTIRDNILFAFEREQLLLTMDLRHKPANLTPLAYVQSIGTLADNLYFRPLREPDGVDTTGYGGGSRGGHNPNFSYTNYGDFTDYPAGGVVNTTWDEHFLSLDVWKGKYGQDKGTKKTPRSVAALSDLRLESNPTQKEKTVDLKGTYEDARGAVYDNSITLQPYTSAVLMRKQ